MTTMGVANPARASSTGAPSSPKGQRSALLGIMYDPEFAAIAAIILGPPPSITRRWTNCAPAEWPNSQYRAVSSFSSRRSASNIGSRDEYDHAARGRSLPASSNTAPKL